MAEGTCDWMTAAACSEGPRLEVTFADLPEHHQSEIVRLVLVAAATTAYFVAAMAFGQPLASRNLTASARLPAPGQPRPVVIEVRAADTPPPPRASKRHTVQPSDAVEVVAFRDAGPDAPPARPASPRRNVFSRFFRGLLRSVGPAA
jgi:hypothetical protein